MKKLITLLFAAGLATAAFAQRSDSYRNDSRSYDNSYQSSPYSNNDQYSYQDQYCNEDQYNRNSQWGDHNRFDRERRIARERYEYEMMMRRRQALYRQRMYDSYYPYGYNRKPSLQIRIGIGGSSRY